MFSHSHKSQTILFYIAMEREAAPLRSLLNLRKDPLFESDPIANSWVGIYENMKIVMMLAKPDKRFDYCDSIGPESAALVTYIGIQTYHPDLVISCGTAGAYETEKNKGNTFQLRDLCYAKEGVPFLGREIFNDDFKSYFEGRYDVTIYEKIFNQLDFKPCVVGTVSSFCEYCKEYSVIQKADLQEMEAASVGKMCYLMKTPFMALKIVSNVEYSSSPDEVGRDFWIVLDEYSLYMSKKLVDFLEEISKIDIRINSEIYNVLYD